MLDCSKIAGKILKGHFNQASNIHIFFLPLMLFIHLDCLEWGTQFCRFQLLFFFLNYNGFKSPFSYALFHNCFMNIIIWLKLCLVVIKAALFQQQCLTCHV